MKQRLSALIVEDSLSDTLLLLRVLQQAGYDVEHMQVDNAVDMQAALEQTEWDVILSDFSMPNFSATAALELVQAQGFDIPFIIVSGTMGEEAAVTAMKSGAHDYFPKGRVARLGVAIDREVREAQERQRRRQVEEELRQAELRFTQAFRSNPSAIAIRTLTEDVILDANPQFLTLFGYQRDDIIGRRMGDLGIWVNPHERFQLARKLQKQTSIYNYETRLQSQTQGVRDVLVSLEPMDLEGEACVLTFILDITERKEAERELVALYNATSFLFKADTLQTLGRQVVQAVVEEFQHLDCGLIFAQPGEPELIRLARAGQQQIQTTAPLFRDSDGLVAESIRTGRLIYVPNVANHPDYIANNAHTRSELVVPLQTTRGVIGVLDLQSTRENAFTERDQRVIVAFAEQAAAALEIRSLYETLNRHAAELEQRVAERTAELHRTKERVEAILNNSSDAIVLVDAEGFIQQTNPAFDALFGYATDALFQHPLTEAGSISQTEQLKAAIENVVRRGQPERLELVAQRQDHTTFDVDLALAPITDEESQKHSVICSFRDITEWKQLEESLRQAVAKERELNALKTRFTSMVSHEFRNPLAIMQVTTDTLSRYYDRLDDERRKGYLDRIQQQITRLNNLIDDILILSRSQMVGVELADTPLNLTAVCQRIVEEVQAGTSTHHIQLTVTGSRNEVMMDEKLLRGMLGNLLSNAIKYSPQGGDIHLALIYTDDAVVLSVTDHGIGIPGDDIDRLFDDFYRAGNVSNLPGTGLGLAIVKQAVAAHHGTIQVESDVGVGTKFTVTFPTAT